MTFLFSRVATPADPTLSGLLTNGVPRLTFSGTANVNYQVLASTNLMNWTTILTTNPPALPLIWTDIAATDFAARFYRVTSRL